MAIDRAYVSSAEDGSRQLQGNRQGNALPNQSPVSVRYPAGLGKRPYEKWILFMVKAGRHILRNQVLPDGNEKDDTLASVALYLPDSALNTTTSVAWDQTNLGDISGPMLEAAVQVGKAYRAISGSQTSQPETLLGDVLNKASNFAQAAVASNADGSLLGQLKSAFLGRLASAGQSVAETVATGGGSALEALLGRTINPRTDLLFKNVEYRHHTLNFSLVPKDKAEADSIDKIISIFNYYMLPSYGNGPNETVSQFLIGYPFEFEVQMFSEYNDLKNHHINTIGRSVLKNLSVSNAPDGKVSFVQSGDDYYPTAVNLTLEFQEVRLLGRDSAEIVRGGVNNFPDPRSK